MWNDSSIRRVVATAGLSETNTLIAPIEDNIEAFHENSTKHSSYEEEWMRN